MPQAERVHVPIADLPAQLARALAAAEPEAALRAALSALPIAAATQEQLVERALRVAARAREQKPRASGSELQLALGVLLALHGACAPREVVAGA